MARILLLDDSPTMHRVVRLTFADDQRIEISVARDRSEADQNLSSRKIDLIIAYVRFDGLTDPRYFDALRLVTPRILLLAESEENLEPFTWAGLTHVLRKPFHSDELRQTVEDMLSQSMPSFEIPPMPQTTISPPMVPLSPSVQPVSQKRNAATEESFTVDEPKISEPQVTLDLSFIQAAVEPQMRVANASQKVADPAGPNPLTKSFTSQISSHDVSATHSFSGNESTSLIPPQSGSTSSIPPTSSSAMAPAQPLQATRPVPPATSRKSLAQAIEPVLESVEPLILEDVMMSAKYNNPPQQGRGREMPVAQQHSGALVRPTESVHGVSRQEVEKIVGEAVADAVGKAVRQALTDTLPDLRQALVVEVSQRAVEQLTEELLAVKKALREQMLTDIRDVSAQWLRKETPNLAKDVIREEIRRVIEQL